MRLAASGSVAGMVARNWRRRLSLAVARSSLTAVGEAAGLERLGEVVALLLVQAVLAGEQGVGERLEVARRAELGGDRRQAQAGVRDGGGTAEPVAVRLPRLVATTPEGFAGGACAGGRGGGGAGGRWRGAIPLGGEQHPVRNQGGEADGREAIHGGASFVRKWRFVNDFQGNSRYCRRGKNRAGGPRAGGQWWRILDRKACARSDRWVPKNSSLVQSSTMWP